MKNKIYYLTRSYYPYQKGGGPLMRAGAVKYLQELGWNVTVVMPNYNNKEVVIDDNVIKIPFGGRHIQKLSSLFERMGIYEDYLDKWVGNAFKYLKENVKKEDILFSTSGGELGMIKLGSLLKKEIGSKFVVNFRDPLNYGYMNGLRRDLKPHVGREKAQNKYITNADLVLTSSNYYAKVLKKRFPFISDKIHNNYFGYIKQIDTSKYTKKESTKLRIAYVGMMSSTQKPELLYKAYKKLNDKDVEIYFIGDTKNYRPILNIKDNNVHLINYLPHEEFLKFMCENIDVGFLSLVNDYYGACVPSKLYEYINLELPIIGALPDGDAKDIINDMNYGKASNYNDIDGLSGIIKSFKYNKFIEEKKNNIIKDRDVFFMKNKIYEVDKLLKEMIL